MTPMVSEMLRPSGRIRREKSSEATVAAQRGGRFPFVPVVQCVSLKNRKSRQAGCVRFPRNTTFEFRVPRFETDIPPVK